MYFVLHTQRLWEKDYDKKKWRRIYSTLKKTRKGCAVVLTCQFNLLGFFDGDILFCTRGEDVKEKQKREREKSEGKKKKERQRRQKKKGEL